jgi:hypothetical protein
MRSIDQDKLIEAIELFKYWGRTYNQRFDEAMFLKVVREQGFIAAYQLTFSVFSRHKYLLEIGSNK